MVGVLLQKETSLLGSLGSLRATHFGMWPLQKSSMGDDCDYPGLSWWTQSPQQVCSQITEGRHRREGKVKTETETALMRPPAQGSWKGQGTHVSLESLRKSGSAKIHVSILWERKLQLLEFTTPVLTYESGSIKQTWQLEGCSVCFQIGSRQKKKKKIWQSRNRGQNVCPKVDLLVSTMPSEWARGGIFLVFNIIVYTGYLCVETSRL